MVCVEQKREELQLGLLGWYETWLQGGRRTCIQVSGIALRLLGVWECGSGLWRGTFLERSRELPRCGAWG